MGNKEQYIAAICVLCIVLTYRIFRIKFTKWQLRKEIDEAISLCEAERSEHLGTAAQRDAIIIALKRMSNSLAWTSAPQSQQLIRAMDGIPIPDEHPLMLKLSRISQIFYTIRNRNGYC